MEERKREFKDKSWCYVCVDNRGLVLSELTRFHQSCCASKVTLFEFHSADVKYFIEVVTFVACKNLLCPQRSLMPPPSSSPLLLFFLLLCPQVWSYEAPEDKQDVFARRPCPAFLTFTNAAYLAGVTLELPCHCKPQQVTRPSQNTFDKIVLL